ncbi:hypothetical protein JW916_12515 [Candidatus Sumerlaeota bacterium]|nr:hypothetical protein [Candidatus Sumerlaeota bacterium]
MQGPTYPFFAMNGSSRNPSSSSQREAPRETKSAPATSRRLRILSGLAVLVYLLAWTRPFGFFSRLLSGPLSDYALHAVPLRSWFFESVRSGDGWAFWNPLWMGGIPVVETVQAAVFYPPVWLHSILPDVPAANLLQLAHLWGAAMSMWLLVRILGGGAWGALLGGLVYGFSGFAALRTYAGHVNFLFAATWAPIAAAALCRIVYAGRYRAFAWGAAAWASMLVSGNLQVPLMTALILVPFGLVCAVGGEGRGARGTRWTGLAVGVAMAVAGTAMGAPQWLAAWAYLPDSIRGMDLVPYYYSSLNVDPAWLLGLVFPRLFGPMHVGDIWIGWEKLAPLGAPALAFAAAAAVFALVAGRSRTADMKRSGRDVGGAPVRFVVFFAIVFAVFVLLSLGDRTPLLRFARSIVPPLQSFRNPGRFLYGACFAGSVLSGLGLSVVLQLAPDARRRVGRTFLFSAGTLAIVYVLLFYPRGSAGDHWRTWTKRRLAEAEATTPSPPFRSPEEGEPMRMWRAERYAEMRYDVFKAIALLAVAGAAILWNGRRERPARWLAPVLVLIVGVDLLDYAAPLMRTTPASALRWPAETERQLRELVGSQWRVSVAPGQESDRVSYAEVRGAWGYEPVAPRDVVRLWHLDQGEPPEIPQPFLEIAKTTPYLDRWAVRWNWGLESSRLEDLGWIRRGSLGGRALYENPRALPRSRFVARAQSVQSPEEALLRIDQATSQTGGCVFVETAVEESAPASTSREAATAIPVAVDTPTRVVLKGAIPTTGYVVLADTWLDGWRVFVDGKPARILRADGAMRAVAVEAGEHEIAFEYRGTTAARAGRWIGIISVFVFVLLAGVSRMYNASSLRKADRS